MFPSLARAIADGGIRAHDRCGARASRNSAQIVKRSDTAQGFTGKGSRRSPNVGTRFREDHKDRVDDALNAIRAAVEEGIVPGGGVMLRKAAKAITVKGDNEDQDAASTLCARRCNLPCAR
jgi:hypothetical protein